MKISYNWLRKYVDLDVSSEELEKYLTFSGIEVEKTEKIGEKLENIYVGKILKKEEHPDSDHLSICEVDWGKDISTVVCGAPNCAANQKIAFAPIGSKVGSIKIKKSKIRGQISMGMICSGKELEISDDHNGILVLKESASVGESLSNYLNKKDTIFELEITPNRPDLLGFVGIARDLSALTKKEVLYPHISFDSGKEKIENHLSLENLNEDKCTRYTARLIKNVQVKESPDWLKERLISIGLRPINNVVDVTNFVMMEYGHPLHAFDYDKIDGNTILVRNATEGEIFPALDDNEYKLCSDDLVIADASKPIALAGVIGGKNSHITGETTSIVIEAANFLYSSVRKTSGRHKIFTDSSYRFERNISDATADIVSRRAVQLILELAGGEVFSGLLDSYPQKKDALEVELRLAQVKKILTIDLSQEQIINYLKPLGFKVSKIKDGKILFQIPHFRRDIYREIDIIEEIIRLYGYNNVETQTKVSNIMNKREFYAARALQDIFVKYGFFEAVNWTFANPSDLDKLNLPEGDERRSTIYIKNPLGNSFSILRTTLLPDLLKNLKFNLNHGAKDIKLFEMNKIFIDQEQKLANEQQVLSAVATGNRNGFHWMDKSAQIDFFDLKGILEEIVAKYGLKRIKLKKSDEKYYQTNASADMFLRNKKIASLGKMDLKVLAKFDIKVPVWSITVYFDKIMELSEEKKYRFGSISKFPPILRDISFTLSEEFNVQSIINYIKEVNSKIIQDVVLFDEFRGKNIEKGYRSLSMKIIFNSPTKTLTDEYIFDILNKVIKKLEKEFKIKMR